MCRLHPFETGELINYINDQTAERHEILKSELPRCEFAPVNASNQPHDLHRLLRSHCLCVLTPCLRSRCFLRRQLSRHQRQRNQHQRWEQWKQTRDSPFLPAFIHPAPTARNAQSAAACLCTPPVRGPSDCTCSSRLPALQLHLRAAQGSSYLGSSRLSKPHLFSSSANFSCKRFPKETEHDSGLEACGPILLICALTSSSVCQRCLLFLISACPHQCHFCPAGDAACTAVCSSVQQFHRQIGAAAVPHTASGCGTILHSCRQVNERGCWEQYTVTPVNYEQRSNFANNVLS